MAACFFEVEALCTEIIDAFESAGYPAMEWEGFIAQLMFAVIDGGAEKKCNLLTAAFGDVVKGSVNLESVI